MKKLTLTSVLVLTVIILSACSAPVVSLSKDAAGLLNSAADLVEQQVAAQANTAVDTAPIAQPTPVPPSPEGMGLLAAYQGVLQSVYERVNPSVVNIRVLVEASGLGSSSGELPFEFPNIPGFPGIPGMPDNPDQPQAPEQPYGVGLGSGFVWDNQGHIITNNHVIDSASKIEVTFSDGTTVPAELVGTDPYSDLAVLKVKLPADSLQPVEMADSGQLKVGQLAIAIGNPFGLEGTMTVGIISALGRTMPSNLQSNGPTYSIPDVIQTDAPINPGNSGGVLVNDQGQVTGVTFAIESSSGSNAGIGFVIPSSIVNRVVPSLIKNGSYEHPYLGISGGGLTPAMVEAMGLKSGQRGVLVANVVPGGPADKAGVRGGQKEAQVEGQSINIDGDVIVAIDGQAVKDMDDLISYLANNTQIGQKVALTVLRDGKQIQVNVTLEARPSQKAQAPTKDQPQPGQAKAWIGIAGSDLNAKAANSLGLDSNQQGVLIERVQPGGPADNAGLREQDVIIAIEEQSIHGMADLAGYMSQAAPGQTVIMTILRDGKQIEISVELGERPASQ